MRLIVRRLAFYLSAVNGQAVFNAIYTKRLRYHATAR